MRACVRGYVRAYMRRIAATIAGAMIYKFKSAASGDVIMLGPQGDQLLRLLSREPAAKGIVEPRDMAAAVAALRSAIERAEQRAAGKPPPGAARAPGDGSASVENDTDGEPAVSLRRRLWPMIDMFERAARADVPVVWGV